MEVKIERQESIKSAITIDSDIDTTLQTDGIGLGSMSDANDDNELDPEIVEDMDPRERLAITLMNWSTISENDEHMLHVSILDCYFKESCGNMIRIKI